MTVRKWTIPLTLAGLGGVSAMLFSQRGRNLLRGLTRRARPEPERLVAWNDSARSELHHIQQQIRELERSLETHSAR